MRSGGHADFYDEMRFGRDHNQRIFNSWRHQRPEVLNGAWQLQGCELVIEGEDLSWRHQVQVVVADARRLVLRSLVADSGEKISVYRLLQD